MKKLFFTTALTMFFAANSALAQYEYYPALFGRQTFYGGSARYLAISGAGTSLGGDLGAANVNPAGLGMYRKSELSFSPNFGFSGSNTSFLDESQHSNKGSFGLSNLAIAICGAKDDLDESEWRGGTFSIGMSKTNSFHNKISFYGTDPQSSMADYFVQQGNGTPESDLASQDPSDVNGTGIVSLAGLAYWSYLITPMSSGGSQYTNFLLNENFTKDGTYTTTGGQNQWNIAYGANYKDKLYVGGGIGITSINFKEELSYTETSSSSTNAFSSFTFTDNNKIKGTGLNMKLGYIYSIMDVIKIGTTITTPTFYWMNQEYSSDLSAQFDTTNLSGAPTSTSESMVPGYFKFNYSSPVKLAAGMSVFAGKSGFVSADIEFIPYQFSTLSGRSSTDNKYLTPFNKIINNSYTNVVNLKIGGELRLDILRLRIGSAYLPNPYKYSDGVNRNMGQFSAGAGVKLDNVYFDFALINTRCKSSYQPYQLTNFITPTAVSTNSFVNAVFTMGFYFE